MSKYNWLVLKQVVTCADDVRHRVWRLNSADEDDFQNKLKIKGLARRQDADASVPAACQDVLNRLAKKTTTTSTNNIQPSNYCKTPRSLRKLAAINERTPEARAILSPISANDSPLFSNGHSQSQSRGASRKLDMANAIEFSSPTSDLPNYVMDGRSPNEALPRTSVKRKRLDWLTNFSQKLTPNKSRRIK